MPPGVVTIRGQEKKIKIWSEAQVYNIITQNRHKYIETEASMGFPQCLQKIGIPTETM